LDDALPLLALLRLLFQPNISIIGWISSALTISMIESDPQHSQAE
jgi:hypothetical protein